VTNTPARGLPLRRRPLRRSASDEMGRPLSLHVLPPRTWRAVRHMGRIPRRSVLDRPEWSAAHVVRVKPGRFAWLLPALGSPMFFKSQRWPDEVHVARALFTDALDRDPTVHVYYDNHVPWLTVNDDLPKRPGTT